MRRRHFYEWLVSLGAILWQMTNSILKEGNFMNTKRFFVLLASLLFVVMVLPPMIACPDEALAAQVKYRWKISQDKSRGTPMSLNFVNNFCLLGWFQNSNQTFIGAVG